MLKFFDQIKLDETQNQADLLLDEIHEILFMLKSSNKEESATTHLILNPREMIKKPRETMTKRRNIKCITENVVVDYAPMILYVESAAIKDCVAEKAAVKSNNSEVQQQSIQHVGYESLLSVQQFLIHRKDSISTFADRKLFDFACSPPTTKGNIGKKDEIQEQMSSNVRTDCVYEHSNFCSFADISSFFCNCKLRAEQYESNFRFLTQIAI